jgi:hypothetical protein
MTKANPLLWPQKVRIKFYNGRGKCLLRSSDRKLDLFDELILSGDRVSRTVYFGLSTTSPKWANWDEENISKIEWLIGADLGFDGCYVNIKRRSENQGAACSEEFLWKLMIRQR